MKYCGGGCSPADMYRIVAIHGLGGHRERTFTNDGAIWLKDFLPEHNLIAPMNPRVSTFGYNSAIAFGKSVSEVRDFAHQLLNELRRIREESQSTGIPIVLVTHSLGGIVAKAVRRQRHRFTCF
jgi:predicted esterase